MWKPLGSLLVTTKQKIKCECQCGKQYDVRAREIIDGKTYCCRSCSSKLKMLKIPKEDRIRMAKHASLAAVVALAKKEHPYKNKYGVEEYKIVSNTLRGAKQRCTNPYNQAYSNYGGRGIEFRFASLKTATEWALDNIGVRPSPFHSLDRIDNNRHYEPGNLRWATNEEQARNKRQYRRTNNGERIKVIKELRPDLTYETIRLWIVQGLSDGEIINRRKYARSSL